VWSPSSLIFIVLLGVWAAYFLQYWIRRRDHLATARSVEQFSEAMRVLERRDTTPRTDLSEPAPRSWNVHPAKATTRPQVLVKRAVPSEPVTPMVTARIDGAPAATSTRTAARPSGSEAPAPVSRPAAATTPAAGTARPSRPTATRVRPSRRVRALLMLVALVELVGITVLVGLGSLQPWALAPAGVALVASFAFVRAGVRAEQRLRASRRRAATSRRATTPAAAPATAAPATPAPMSRPARPSSTTVADDVPATVSTDSGADDAVAAPVSENVAADVPAVESPVVEEPAAVAEPEHIEYVHLVDEDDIPLTWEPVPVPRPTYTMKARAERPEVPPAEVTPDPAPVALPDEDSVPERRVAGA
jgi:hypothetical protein